MELIETGDQILDWFQQKPDQWEKVSAIRSVLRILPYVADLNRDWLDKHGLVFFQALLIAWARGRYPSINTEKASQNAAEKIIRADEDGYQNNVNLGLRKYSAGLPFYHVVRMGLSSNNELSFVDGIALTFRFHENLKQIFSYDLDFMQKEFKSVDNINEKMLTKPLFLFERPDDWDSKIQKFDEVYRSISPSYSFLFDWYVERVEGRATSFGLDQARHATQEKQFFQKIADATEADLWGKGHEYVNITLRQWLEEIRADMPSIAKESETSDDALALAQTSDLEVISPRQEPGATAYGINNEGKLDRLPHIDQQHLRDTPDQRRIYADIRERALDLQQEGQRLGLPLLNGLDRFNQSTPELFEDAETYLVWRDGNALRRLYWAHRKIESSLDPDPARLEATIAEGLGSLLDLFNNFAIGDDGLRAKDERRISLQEQAQFTEESKAAKPIIDAILASPEIATDAVRLDIIAEFEVNKLSRAEPYSAQILDQSNRTWRNIVAAILSAAVNKLPDPATPSGTLAYGVIGNALYDAGTGAITVAAGFSPVLFFDFIGIHATILQPYVAIAFSSYPHLPELIERILHLWDKVRN